MSGPTVGLALPGAVGPSAFSGTRGEVFVVSGVGAGARIAVANTRDGTVLGSAVSGVVVGTPLSITYRISDDRLYLADRLGTGAVRILRVDRDGAASELGRIDSPGVRRQDIYLSTMPQGQLLFTAAGNEWDNALYLILKPELSGLRVVSSRYDSRPGKLMAPPVATGPAGVAIAKAGASRQPDFTRMTPVQFRSEGLKPLSEVAPMLRAASGVDNCSFETPAVGNDCSQVRHLAVYASRKLLIGDRTLVKLGASGYAAVASGGMMQTDIGVEAKVGHLWSRGAVTVRDRGKVNGFARGGSSVTLLSGATVTGALLRNQTMNLLPLGQFNVVFPSSTEGNVTVVSPPPGGVSERVLEPGAYGNVAVRSRGKIFLRSGVYSFQSLVVDADATISLNTSLGPIFVYVQSEFRFQGKILNAQGPRADFLIAVFGTQMVQVNAPFIGTIVAPNANLVLAPSPTGHVGSFFGKDVEVGAQTTVSHEPFNYPWIP